MTNKQIAKLALSGVKLADRMLNTYKQNTKVCPTCRELTEATICTHCGVRHVC